MVYGRYNYSFHGLYKPTYNWGAPSCNKSLQIIIHISSISDEDETTSSRRLCLVPLCEAGNTADFLAKGQTIGEFFKPTILLLSILFSEL